VTNEIAFNDHFSDRSAQYAQYRPDYPGELFSFIAEQCPGHDLALDCATGNGQAAVGLSHHFSKVIGTDASETQIASAVANSRVEYRVAAAEDSGLEAHCADLITVAQALHWFDHARFFAEARRVLRPGGLMASWCYEVCQVSHDCDAQVNYLYEDIVGEFWPPERRFVEAGYANIELPETCIDAPVFQMQVDWNIQDMLGYLRTWSACKRFGKKRGKDPVSIIEPALTAAWGSTIRQVRWPVTMKACRF
jgi:SAM-dependent methyltransferase